MDFQKRAQAEMSMTYVTVQFLRVEGWMGGFSKKGPSGDLDDLCHSSISRFQRVEGWQGGFSKKGPSGDVDDVCRPFDFKGWKGGFSKKGPSGDVDDVR